ncbi:Starch-binding associating with outer membrane [Filimonas lacunae]|uniref:Starch-binding associating with outer membrane n=2 Tax=Filimonas lacunae TaxID=477680 RepID=A0A1N7LFT6_9BACT|nr:Starch-binding associating with outer membrane [Filimonas lacunae]
MLEEKPKSIAVENFYNTVAEVETGVNAAYVPVRNVNMFGALYPIQLETYTEYMYGRGSHAALNDYQGLDNTNITRTENIWQYFYEAIRNANLVIGRAPHGNAISEAYIKKYVGEARFIRALWYFHLVRNWAGVPLRTENNMDSIHVRRSSEAEVYQLIVNDLLYAETNLPDVPRLSGAPSTWSAKTLLTDVYMNLKEYTKARDKALEVINSNKYSLVNVTVANDFEKLFGADISSSTEEIFYLKFARTPSSQIFLYPQYIHYPNSGYYPPGGFYTIYSDSVQNLFLKNWDKNDLRYRFNWYAQTFGLGNTTVLNKKYVDKNAVTGGGNDFPMYRYADLLLWYAEAEARVNNSADAAALESLNKVHRRAYGKNPAVGDATTDFTLLSFGSLTDFISRIALERGYENVSEGKHWHDLKRLDLVQSTILAYKGKTVAVKHLLWPIPKTEYNYNKAIDPVKDQNPGY